MSNDQFQILLAHHAFQLRRLRWLRAGIEAQRVIQQHKR
jgi:hypothetical protein